MLSTYTAKNLDDALREACIKKDCRIDELTYNVLEENKGFLGIGSSVKIEAYCLNDVKDLIKLNTRHYAKRQLTWFRNSRDVLMYNIENGFEDLIKIIGEWLNK